MNNLSNLVVTRRPVGDLKPYPKNARQHSRKQLRKIAESLQRFGWTNPILIDESGMVLAGHGRLEAARMLGWELVETICLAGFTGEEKRAYILADNRIAEEAGWDRELLAIEFSTLIEDGFEVELTGFDTIEIDRVLSFDVPSDSDEERVDLPDENEVAVSRLGDVWTIGESARLTCGKSRARPRPGCRSAIAARRDASSGSPVRSSPVATRESRSAEVRRYRSGRDRRRATDRQANPASSPQSPY